jgi:DNA-binding response OmpR family regulator
MLILIAEDDANLRRGLSDLLTLEGFETVVAEDGASALEAFTHKRPDFCILDVGMPKLKGFDLCRAIRERNSDVPILFLTARTEEIDRVLGFGIGADDYIGKPFSSRELVARIKAIARRTAQPAAATRQNGHFTMGDLSIDPRAMRAFRREERIDLSRRELGLLQLLYDRAGQAVSRDEIYDRCWGRAYYPNSRALDQFVASLRRKIEQDPAVPRIIGTVHGIGYRFDR